MFAERQAKHPRATYKVLVTRQDEGASCSVVNLRTGKHTGSFSMWGFIKAIEADMAENRAPQFRMQYRSWGSGRPEGSLPASNVVLLENAREKKLSKPCQATFIVKVLFMQNATWQGTVQWIEGRQSRHYRSTNELLNLIDDAIELDPAGTEESSE
jgi:hypothetical protein